MTEPWPEALVERALAAWTEFDMSAAAEKYETIQDAALARMRAALDASGLREAQQRIDQLASDLDTTMRLRGDALAERDAALTREQALREALDDIAALEGSGTDYEFARRVLSEIVPNALARARGETP